jgi:imidazolonepropionase-like amidohydrolase
VAVAFVLSATLVAAQPATSRPAQSPTVARTEVVALVGATVHPMSGPALPNATIVVREGRIVSVGAGGPPAGARVIDLAGKHVYPGFVLADSVIGLTEIGAVDMTNDYAEIGQVNPNVRAEVAINPDSELIPVARVNGVTSALVAPRGGAIAGTSALVRLDGWTWEDMTRRTPVGLHVFWPRMSVSRAWWETRSEEEQKKQREEAVKALGEAFEHARAFRTAQRVQGQAGVPRLDRDVKWEAMAKAIDGEIPVFVHASSLAQIRAALTFLDDQGIGKAVLVGGSAAWRVADELKRRDIAVITGTTLATPGRDEPYDDAFTLPLKLQQAGVRFAIGDGGTNPSNARNLPYVAAMAAAFGLPAEEALKAITLYPAQILGVADLVGSIEPGKAADLVVTDGDPLEITTTVEQVWIAGRAIPMESRHTRLFEKYDAKPRGPTARVR